MTNILRCLHITDSLDLEKGGTSRSVLDLTIALQSIGVETTVASMDVGKSNESFPEYPTGPRVHVFSAPSRFTDESMDLIRNSDVVHLHTPWWPKNPELVRMARECGKPVVLTTHGMLDDWSMTQKAYKKWLYLMVFARRMIRECVLHCTAESERDQVLKRVKPKSAIVIPLVINAEYLGAELDPSLARDRWPHLQNNSATNSLFLSRIHPKKGLDVAIRALQFANDSVLYVAGPCDSPEYFKSLQHLAAQCGVAARVHWLGSVHGKEKQSLLAACDCLVLPTQQENFGLVLIEGLSFGMQVITSKGTDIWKELQSCGASIVERTPQAFGRAMEEFNKMENDRSVRTIGQRSKVSRWMNPVEVISSFEGLYRSLSHGRTV